MQEIFLKQAPNPRYVTMFALYKSAFWGNYIWKKAIITAVFCILQYFLKIVFRNAICISATTPRINNEIAMNYFLLIFTMKKITLRGQVQMLFTWD